MVQAKGEPFKVVLTGDQKAAIQDASYVITQLRVGQMPARVADEYLGLRHGLDRAGDHRRGWHGQSPAHHPGGVKNCRRYARAWQPRVRCWLTSPTRPGWSPRRCTMYAPDVPAVGVCNVPITTKMGIIAGLKELKDTDVTPERTELNTLGLNHLSWHRGFTVDGEDIWPQVIEADAGRAALANPSRSGTRAPSRSWACCPTTTCSTSTTPTTS